MPSSSALVSEPADAAAVVVTPPEPLAGPTDTARAEAALLFLLMFTVSFAVETRVFDLRVFVNWDVWFHSDPNVYWRAFTQPWSVLDRHPLAGGLAWLTTAPAALLLGATGVIDADFGAIQRWLALLVVPAAVGMRAVLFLGILRRTIRSRLASWSLALADGCSAASLTVGSVPETYALSALAITVLAYLAVRNAGTNRASFTKWVAAGFLATGITVTNVLAVALLRGAVGNDTRPWRRVTAAGLVAFCALMGNLFFVAVQTGSMEAAVVGLAGGSRTGQHVHPPTVHGARELAWSAGFTYLAPLPRLERSWAPPDVNPEYDFILSYAPPIARGPESWWRATLTAVIVALGLFGHWRRGRDRALAVSMALCAVSAALVNLFYGDHYFLYAMHWQPALTWIIAGTVFVTRESRFGVTVIGAFTVLTLANSAWLLPRLLQTLAGA